MIRHFKKKKLYNHSRMLLMANENIWNLPPMEIARFGGEISKVMLEAAEQYILEKSLFEQKKRFERAAFHQSKP